MLHIDGTAATNIHSQFIIVSTATKQQRFQMKTFFLDQILIVTVVPHNLLSDECLVFFYDVDAASEPDRYAFSDVRGHFQPNHFRGPRPALLCTPCIP
ncbi:hypothetical protein HMPREF9346_05271 [Escherichia coli MS 119-7]|nr:hypothetical protein HMPREF9346_05271 [Escherichia coli MS 119-7]